MHCFPKTVMKAAAAAALVIPLISGTAAIAEPTVDQLAQATSWSERSPDEYNAEQQELAKYLAENGISATIEADGGLGHASFDETNEAAWDAVNAFYYAKYPPSQEAIALSRISATELAAFLTARGISAATITEGGGYAFVDYDTSDPETLDAVEDFEWLKNPLAKDEIDEMNSTATKLTESLTAQGATATLVTDRHGIQHTEADWNDEAVQAAYMKYLDANPGIFVG